MATLYTLSESLLRRLNALLRAYEGGELARAPSPANRPPDPVQMLKITGAASGGLYPAKVSWWDDGAGAEKLLEEVRWKARDASAPSTNDYVWGRFAGRTADGTKALFVGAKNGADSPGVVVSGYTGTQTIVTDVTWDTVSCTMTKTTKSFAWEDGLLKSVT